MPTWWYLEKQSEQTGPVAFAEPVEMVRAGEVTAADRVRADYLNEWQWADSVPGLFYMARRAEEREESRVESPESSRTCRFAAP